MDEFELGDIDFDEIERKNNAKIERMNEEVLVVEDEDGCAGGACMI